MIVDAKKNTKTVTDLQKLKNLTEEERESLKKVSEIFKFKSTEYYLSLIDWKDKNDPIRRLIVPTVEELEKWGEKDPSYEKSYTVVPGLQHKYRQTALFLAGQTCFGYCRFCFRKRLFFKGNSEETMTDIDSGISYIKGHEEINNVLLTGGDPLTLSTKKLKYILLKLSEIKHIINLRIGTKALAFNPYRIISDEELIETFKTVNRHGKRIYIIAQFDNPRELTDITKRAVDKLLKSGCVILTQMPLLKGINDSPEILSKLWNKSVSFGISPYYLFICRPTVGNKPYAVPIERGYEIFEQAKMNCSGIAKRIRYVMSHATGKLEVTAMTENFIFFKYHQSSNPENIGKILVFKRNSEAYWLEDYGKPIETYKLKNPFL